MSESSASLTISMADAALEATKGRGTQGFAPPGPDTLFLGLENCKEIRSS